MRWPILLLLALTTAPRDLPGQASGTTALAHLPASTLVQVVAPYRPEPMIEVSAEVSLPAKGAAR